uniref:Uncharacterized protein n=1 Tax=Zea mays TaxID=4577 RepID=A0A804QM75_MAIZE
MEPGTRLSTSSLPTTGSFCAQLKPKPKDMSSSDAKPGQHERQSAIARRRKRHRRGRRTMPRLQTERKESAKSAWPYLGYQRFRAWRLRAWEHSSSPSTPTSRA